MEKCINADLLPGSVGLKLWKDFLPLKNHVSNYLVFWEVAVPRKEFCSMGYAFSVFCVSFCASELLSSWFFRGGNASGNYEGVTL